MRWSDDQYKKAFAEGHERNKYVAGLVSGAGLWVDCPPLRFADTKYEVSEFTKTEKDVRTRAGVLEVKGQGRLFTADVSEFPYETQIVDTVESWEGKTEKPIAYVMVCMKNMECIVVPSSTRPKWRTKRFRDHKKGEDFDFFLADKSCIRSFPDLLYFLARREREWNEKYGPIAQWLEQGTHNASVGGSIPSRPTMKAGR